MAGESGLKAWVQKHSPIKGRNKPLPPPPPPPVDDSPARKPMKELSGNEAGGKTPSRLRAFLNKKLPSNPPSPSKQEHVRTVITAETLRRSPIRRSLRQRIHKVPDVNKLTTKITVLEAQLEAAKRELQSAARPGPPAGRSVSDEINRAIEEKQRSLGAGDRYNGVIESLLGNRSASKRSISSKAPQLDLDWAYADYLAAEDGYEPTVAAIETPTSWRGSRSAVRNAGWSQIQAHIAEPSRSKRGRHEQALERTSMDRPAQRRKLQHDTQTSDDVSHIKIVEMEASRKSSSDGERPRLQRQHSTIESVHDRDNSESQRATGRSATANYEVEPIDESHEPRDVEQPVARKLRCVSPSKLQTVNEEYEWNDEEIF